MEIKNNTILAIDDNGDNLITIKALVTDVLRNATVLTATSGRSGIEMALEHRPDVILLDVLMPDMDGFEVCERIKADPELCDIPVVFVTAIKDDKNCRIRALEAGADAFLSKPIDESELKAQIKAMLKIRILNQQHKNENVRLAGLVADQTRELKKIHVATLNLLEDLRQENEARRKTEDALRASEALYRSILDASPDNIIITDSQARILIVSPKLLIQYGISPDHDLIGRSVIDFICKEDQRKATIYVSHMLKGMKIGTHEYKSVVMPNGKNVDFEVNGGVILNPYGEIDKLVFIARDISERKQAQQALRESEKKYRFITEKISDVVWLMDLHGRSLFVSPSVENFTGFTVEEYLEQSFVELFTPDSAGKAQSIIQEQVALYLQEQPAGYSLKKTAELDYHCKDGTVKTGELVMTPYFDDYGKLVGIHGVTRDVTEAKRAEEALKASEALYRSVLTASPDDIKVTDLKGKILMSSPASYKLTGYTQDELVGRNILELLLSEDVVRAKEDFYQVMSGKYFGPFEYKLKRADDRLVDVEVNAEYVRSQDDTPVGMVVIIRDITERKIADEKLRHIARLYALLGQVNQAIVRVSETKELLSRLCQIAVEFGQFRMVWVGVPDDEQNLVKPLYFAGHEAGYLDVRERTFDLDVEDTVVRAFRSGQMTYCNDIVNEPEMIRFPSAALERGYRSCISVPLKQKDEVIAIFTFYAAETGFFNQEEQLLLYEIGEDISFSLDAFYSQMQRDQAEVALKQSKAELKAIYDNAPVMMCLINRDRQVLFANRAFDEFVDVISNNADEAEPREIKVGGLLGCVYSVKSPSGCGESSRCGECQLREAIKRTFETGVGETNVEYYSKTLSVRGSRREMYLLVSTALIQTDNDQNLLLCLSDITDRKLAEDALQKSEMLLRTFIDNIPFAIWARDSQNIGILENRKSVEQVGSIIGRTPEMQPGLDVEVALLWGRENEQAMKGEILHSEIVSFVEGEERIFDKIVFPIKTDDHIIGIAGFNIDITDRKKDEEALRMSREELKNFSVHLQNVREEERVLLAREIHDDLGQILVAMKIDMGILKQNVMKNINRQHSAEVMSKFEDISKLIDNTIQTARKIMTDLRPDVLELLGFNEAVRQYLRNYEERYKIKCVFNSAVHQFNLTIQQSVALFRIIQEALNNTAKYAKATEVQVVIRKENKKFHLEIKDNGIGFDVNQKKRPDSYGLLGMKERVFLLEGELNIISTPGKGTAIQVVMNCDDSCLADTLPVAD